MAKFYDRDNLLESVSRDEMLGLKEKMKELSQDVLNLSSEIDTIAGNLKKLISKKEDKVEKKFGMNYIEAMLICRNGSDVAIDKPTKWSDGKEYLMTRNLTLDIKSNTVVDKYSFEQHNPTDEELKSQEWYEV